MIVLRVCRCLEGYFYYHQANRLDGGGYRAWEEPWQDPTCFVPKLKQFIPQWDTVTLRFHPIQEDGMRSIRCEKNKSK